MSARPSNKKILAFLFILSLIPLSANAFATVQSASTDKTSYEKGEQIKVTGNVEYSAENPFVVIQIWIPNGSSMADFTTVAASPSGSFSATFVADGPLWTSQGQYKIIISYLGSKIEKVITFSIPEPAESEQEQTTPKPEIKQPAEIKQPSEIKQPAEQKTVVTYLKTRIADFPAMDKSPQYYIDRYNTEPSYKSWFDLQFPTNTIHEVVGYKKTHIVDFPSLSKSPQYYIDRYDTEPNYKSWFDSQFPNTSIYNVLGYPDPVPLPPWIKSNAEWWAQGNISDEAFVGGIEFMIDEKIIIIPNLPESGVSSGAAVPDWVRNTAHWWAINQISEDEFINALKFLIKEGIISVNQ